MYLSYISDISDLNLEDLAFVWHIRYLTTHTFKPSVTLETTIPQHSCPEFFTQIHPLHTRKYAEYFDMMFPKTSQLLIRTNVISYIPNAAGATVDKFLYLELPRANHV